MDLPWGEERTKQFVTNVGLITSNGPYGCDIMACEWTHQVSYRPGLIAVCVNFGDATHTNIAKTKEFGVNLCASDQNVLSSISGGYSGKIYNKIEALKELGFKFFKAKKIGAMMVEGAAMNAECRLFKKIKLGDHTTFVGEVIELYPVKTKDVLVYHGQKYWKTGENIPKPLQDELERVKGIVEKHRRN
ncbi:flavin reductase [Candidatus Woesearchaeota archaeon]|nr:flavin reductase [Candidatus Woesearchaeota archaeon]